MKYLLIIISFLFIGCSTMSSKNIDSPRKISSIDNFNLPKHLQARLHADANVEVSINSIQLSESYIAQEGNIRARVFLGYRDGKKDILGKTDVVTLSSEKTVIDDYKIIFTGDEFHDFIYNSLGSNLMIHLVKNKLTGHGDSILGAKITDFPTKIDFDNSKSFETQTISLSTMFETNEPKQFLIKGKNGEMNITVTVIRK